jgi:hypothetical protein
MIFAKGRVVLHNERETPAVQRVIIIVFFQLRTWFLASGYTAILPFISKFRVCWATLFSAVFLLFF